MRRTMVLVAAVAALTAGCKGGFSAHPDVAAEAAGQTLSAQRVGDILSAAKQGQPTIEAAEFVTNLWVDFQLFAQAVANDRLQADSLTVHDAMWHFIASVRADHWHDSLVARRSSIAPATLDSLMKNPELRVVQHILVNAPTTASAAEKAAAKKKIEGLLAQIRGGANFGQLAVANTDDGGSRADSGYYPPAPRAQWVKPFSDALWSLNKGEVSGIVTTEFGYHIVKYPTDAEARRLYETMARSSSTAKLDSTYFVELDSSYQIKVDDGAPARMRTAFADLDGHRKDKGKIATYKGGTFTVGDLVRWTRIVTADPIQGPQQLAQIKQAPDDQLTQLAHRLTQSSLLLTEADKNNVQLTAEDWTEMQKRFSEEVDSLKAVMGLTAEVLDPKASKADRSKAAALKVDEFFDKLLTGQVRFRVLPGMLAWTLRGREEFGVNMAGVQRGLTLAQEKLGQVPGGAPPAAPGGAIQPAPGPAPLPGGTPPAAPPGGGQ